MDFVASDRRQNIDHSKEELLSIGAIHCQFGLDEELLKGAYYSECSHATGIHEIDRACSRFSLSAGRFQSRRCDFCVYHHGGPAGEEI